MISDALHDAYMSTCYWVDVNPPFYLKVGFYSAPLKQLYQHYHVDSSAFISAYNPHSQAVSLETNQHAHHYLYQRLSSQYVLISGRGQGDSAQKWPAEESFLVLGISREEAIKTEVEFHQNAIVFADKNAVPKLLLIS